VAVVPNEVDGAGLLVEQAFKRLDPVAVDPDHRAIVNRLVCNVNNPGFSKGKTQRIQTGRAFGLRDQIQAKGVGRARNRVDASTLREGMRRDGCATDRARRGGGPYSSAGRIPAEVVGI